MDTSSPNSKTVQHDTHALPPPFIQDAYWHYNKVKPADLDDDTSVIDIRKGLSDEQKEIVKAVGRISGSSIAQACTAFRNSARGTIGDTTPLASEVKDAVIYEHQGFPGLQIIPNILPPETQVLWVTQILHTYLADGLHKNNLEADYDIEYPTPAKDTTSNGDDQHHPPRSSFFTYAPYETKLHPKDPTSANKPLNTTQTLSKRLRWLTLGTQYHWPTRSYPKDPTTAFPADIAALVTGLFPHIKPESGVCLLYGPKDFMPVHRDVSEQCEKALASFSVGCDGIFIVGRGEEEVEDPEERKRRTVAIRVHSGDCIHLDRETRWAWHAMPRTIAGTCPEYLADWPVGTPGASESERKAFEKWKGWMGRKRLNVSCRQVWD